jgi:hypothetical protein
VLFHGEIVVGSMTISATAQSMTQLVDLFPNRGLPRVYRRSQRVMEFPDECLTVALHRGGDTVKLLKLEPSVLDEDFELSHRHFSSMHWLYPATYVPFSNFKTTTATPTSNSVSNEQHALFRAADKTVRNKISSGGGHTSWSSAWSSCLFARLGNGHDAFRALQRILLTYTSSQGIPLTLHPALQPTNGDHCATCYNEKPCPIRAQNKAFLHQGNALGRGLSTSCGDVVSNYVNGWFV